MILDIHTFLIQENALENAGWEMAAILSLPQYVNDLPSDSQHICLVLGINKSIPGKLQKVQFNFFNFPDL